MPRIKKRSTRHQMSSEQNFRSMAGTVSDYYEQYRKQANAALILAAVVIAGWAAYAFTNAGNERKAGALLDTGHAFYRPAGAATPDYAQALRLFQETAKLYGGTLSGAAAQFYAGNSLAGLGRMDEAVKAYEAFVQRHSDRKLLLGMVYQRLGYAYLAMGKQEDAVKAFTLSEGAVGAGPATAELAKLYERSGKAEEAMKKYQEISVNLPGTGFAMEARAKLPPPDLSTPVVPQGQGVK